MEILSNVKILTTKRCQVFIFFSIPLLTPIPVLFFFRTQLPAPTAVFDICRHGHPTPMSVFFDSVFWFWICVLIFLTPLLSDSPVRLRLRISALHSRTLTQSFSGCHCAYIFLHVWTKAHPYLHDGNSVFLVSRLSLKSWSFQSLVQPFFRLNLPSFRPFVGWIGNEVDRYL